MAVTYVGGATANDGQTSAASSAVFTIPAAAQAGDTAIVCIAQNSGAATFTPPSGWTSLSGPDVVSSNCESQVWAKDLVSGDPGSSATFTSSSSARLPGDMLVLRGTAAASLSVTSGSVVTGTTSWTTPAITTTVDNSEVIAILVARTGTSTAPSITTPSGNTAAATAKTAFGTSPNFTVGSFYKTALASPAGSYGGVAVTLSAAATGTAYSLAAAPTSSAFSGSAAFSGSGTLSTVDTPKPATSVALSGSGTLAASGTPHPGASAALGSSGTLNAQPGTIWHAAGSGTLAATVTSVDVSTSASFSSGLDGLVVDTPRPMFFASEGTLSVTPTGMTVTGASAAFDGSEGRLEVSGQGFRFCIYGPVSYDYPPLERGYPQLLHVAIPYGHTIWQDASGVWHDKFWPSPEDLTGALMVFPGGRCSEPTDAEKAAIQASPYADYLHMEELH